MGTNYGPLPWYTYGAAITNGLQLSVNAGISKSYPGTGADWFDLSGNNKHVKLVNTPTFTSNGLKSYFSLNGGNQYFTGSESNSFNILQEHTIEVGYQSNTTSNLEIISFQNSLGQTNYGASGPGYGIHLAIESGPSIKYDVTTDTTAGGVSVTDAGSVGTTNNIIVLRKTANPSTNLLGSGIYRSMYRNNVSKITSTLNTTQVLTSEPVQFGQMKGFYMTGKIFFIRVYNRCLTDSELTLNYKVSQPFLDI